MFNYLPAAIPVLTTTIYFLIISWIVLLKGKRIPDTFFIFLLLNTAQILTVFALTSLFPYTHLFYFILFVLFTDIVTLFIYSFPRSIIIKPSWGTYFAIVSLLLLLAFSVVSSEQRFWLYWSIIPLFAFPHTYFVIRKRRHLVTPLKEQVTLLLSTLIVIMVAYAGVSAVIVETYNITPARYALFFMPFAEIILLFVAQQKKILLTTGLTSSLLRIALGVTIPFTLLTVSLRPILLFLHTHLPFWLITPSATIVVYLTFNLIAFGATISTLHIDMLSNGKQKKLLAATQQLRKDIEKVFDTKELHTRFRTTLFRVFPSISSVRFLCFDTNGNDTAGEAIDVDPLVASMACPQDCLYAVKDTPGIDSFLNELLHQYRSDVLVPFRRDGALCGFYLISGTKMGEMEWEYISSLSTIVAAREGHIQLFNQLMEKEKKLQNRRYLYETGKMISVIAHELRTPLASIMFNLDIILEEINNGYSPDAEYLEIARTELQRLNDTVEKMLTYGRVTNLDTRTGTFDKFITDIKTIASFPDVTFSVQTEHALKEYIIDWDRLKTIVVNLLTNSYQAVKQQEVKEISLAVTERGAFIHIHVTDNGPGIEEDKQKQIFTPFFSTKKDGNGLGLAICEKIAKLMGGGIRLASSRPGFTDFHVWIQKNQIIKEDL